MSEPLGATHARVLVLGARGLRVKGRRGGGGGAVAVLELGGHRLSTGAAGTGPGAAGEPVWREERIFPLPPAAPSPSPTPGPLLRITVLHRSLFGSDAFLGQLALPLTHLHRSKDTATDVNTVSLACQQYVCEVTPSLPLSDGWYKLSSKPGKKEKERGEIQVSVQFVRNHLTASMFDLSSKEKHRSPLAKLRDKVKGKKKHEGPSGDSASAIVPCSIGQLTSDEDLNEMATPEKRSKRGFFSKHKLHRSSLTKSNSSLSSQQSLRSTESFDSNTAVAGLTSPNMPSSPSFAHPPTPTLSTNPSLAKLLTHKRALSDEVNQVLEIHPSHLALKTSAISRSLLCINGSHVYREEPSTKSACGSLPVPAHLCHSHHSVGGKAEGPGPGALAEVRQRPASGVDAPEVRVVPPVIAVNVAGVAARPRSDGLGQETEGETVGGWQGTKPVHAAAPILSTADPPKVHPPAEAKKVSIFPFGSDSEARHSRTPSPVRNSGSLAERSKPSGWFLKDNNHKPSTSSGCCGASEESAPIPGGAGKDWTGLGKPAAEETVPSSLPASTETTSNGSSFHGPDASAETGPSVARRSSALHSPGPEGESDDLEIPSPWVPAGAVPAGSPTDQVPSPAPRDLEVECPEGGENFSWSAQAAGLPMGRSPSVEPGQPGTKASSSLMRLGDPPRAEGDGSPDVAWAVPPTNDASGVDLGICSAPVMDNVSLGKSFERQSGSLTDDGLEVKTGRAFVNGRGVEIGSNIWRSLAPTEGSRSTVDGIGDEPRVVNLLPPGPAWRVTDAEDGDASLTPVFVEGGENESIRGNAHPGSPPVFRSSLRHVAVGAVLGEAMEEGPETGGEGRKAVPGPPGKLAAPLTLSGPPPAKPPRLGDTVGMAEERAEMTVAMDYPSSAVQSREEQRLDQGLEQKVTLVVTGPPFTELNPDASSTPSAAEEPFGPSGNEATEEKSSCGTFEFSLNEKTGEEHYRTCLSNFPAEAMNASTDGDGTSSKSDDFQSTLSMGPMEIHQLVEIQAATLVTTAARVNSLETISLAEERFSSVLERRDVFYETCVAWPGHSEQTEQDFVSAVEELTHKSSPVLSEPGVTLASGGEPSATLEEEAERRGELSTRRGLREGAPAGNAGREGRRRESAELKAGVGTILSGEPVTAGMNVERRAAGEEWVLGQLGGEQVPSSELQGGGECSGLGRRDGGEDVDAEEAPPLEEQEDSTLEQHVVGEDFLDVGKDSSEQRHGRRSCGFERRDTGQGSALAHQGMGQDLALEKRDGGRYATVEKRDGGESSPLGQRDCGDYSTLGQRSKDGYSPLEQRDAGEGCDLPEKPPSGSSPPLTGTCRVLGKVDPNPHGGRPSARDAQRLQALGVGEPVPGHGCPSATSADSSLEEGLSFKELHQKAAPPAPPAPGPAVGRGLLAARRCPRPLAFSTPHPPAAANSRAPDLPSPILPPSSGAAPPPGASQTAVSSQHSPRPAASRGPPLTVSPLETQPADPPFPQPRTSPHPVKPITATALEVTEKKSGRSHLSNTLTSGLEKLKNVTTGHISPMRSPVSGGHKEQEAVKESKLADPVVHYYHLTHDELIKKILQQESQIQKEEEHVRDLEEYIDLLLVHIMEHNPSILQTVSEEMKIKAATK
ncbi:uncharacterized protein LOC144598321 [Rhinoraja longicauda]